MIDCNKALLAIIALFNFFWLTGHAQSTALPDNLTHFAFGSCAKERLPQPIWQTIADTNPQLFLFVGDNMYADNWMADGKTLDYSPVTKPERIAEAYATLAAKPGFAQFRQNTPILAVWDDHDYGADNAGAGFPMADSRWRR